MPHHPAHDGPAAGAAAGPPAAFPPLPVQPRQTMLFFGDSITAADPGYISTLAQVLAHTRPELQLHLVNAGVPGNTIRDLEARLDTDVLARHPQWVVVCIGTNDYLNAAQGQANGVPLPEFVARYQGLLDRLRQAGSTPVLMTIPILGVDDETTRIPDPQPYNAAIRALAGSAGLRLVDGHRAFHEVTERAANYKQRVVLTTDGIHPNRQGHTLLARALALQLGLLRRPAAGAA